MNQSLSLLSVNLGTARKVGKVVSGIYKSSVEGPIELTIYGLREDAVCDKRHHGGPDQAVYVYGGVDYEWWSEQLGERVHPGTFGDNLTIGGITSKEVNVGDRFNIGSVVLEATAPRIPCATLGHRMGDSRFALRFREAERPGFYCRVIQVGTVERAMSVEYVRSETKPEVSILDIFHLYYEVTPTAQKLERVLNAPIAHRMKERFASSLN